MARVKTVPTVTEEDLKPGAKVHGGRVARNPDISQITGAITGRDVHAAAQGDGKVGEVAAHTDPFLVAFGRRAIASGVVLSKLDSLVSIVANGLNTLPSTLDVAEQRPSEIVQLFGVAITAGKQVDQDSARKRIDVVLLLRPGDVVIGHSTVGNEEAITNFE